MDPQPGEGGAKQIEAPRRRSRGMIKHYYTIVIMLLMVYLTETAL